MKKAIVFGIGSRYTASKSSVFAHCDVVALADNDLKKQRTTVDGISIISPNMIPKYQFDFIIVMPKEPLCTQIFISLKALGVPAYKIIYYDHFIVISNYREIFGTYSRPHGSKLLSSVCRPSDLTNFAHDADEGDKLYGMCFSYAGKGPELSIDNNSREYFYHRKIWEHLYTRQALKERGCLKEDKKGLCFASGIEPMPSIFADIGCNITATDAPPGQASDTWKKSNQHSDNVDALYFEHITTKENFLNKVMFRYVDMNHIPSDLDGFDFLWSSCALEHLGSIHNAKNFIYSAMNCLNPGGIAVHTTEITLSSSITTTHWGGTCPLRSVDLIEIAEHLQKLGHHVEPLDFRLDDSEFDYAVSLPPEYLAPHFKIPLHDGSILTSFGIIIRKSR